MIVHLPDSLAWRSSPHRNRMMNSPPSMSVPAERRHDYQVGRALAIQELLATSPFTPSFPTPHLICFFFICLFCSPSYKFCSPSYKRPEECKLTYRVDRTLHCSTARRAKNSSTRDDRNNAMFICSYRVKRVLQTRSLCGI